MRKASWFIALLIGVVIGVAADRMMGGGSRPAPVRPRGAQMPVVPQPAADPRAVYRVPVDDSPVKGPADALVTIVISSDFQCPFCKRVLPTMEELEKKYPGKLRFAFKHNPLSFHPKALPAAIATEEAHAQGGDQKFWEMHDKLFALSPALDRPQLETAASELNLEMDAFRRALDEQRHLPRVKRDQALVTALGASATPAFFINGRLIEGAQPVRMFSAIIDEELRKAEQLVKSGVAPRDVYARIIEKGASSPVTVQGAPSPGAAAKKAPPPQPTAARVPVRRDDPARGAEAAKVTLVVFSDFQCPFCARVDPTMKQVEQTWPGAVRIVWKHRPLSFHPQAMPASEAAEAAREQGAFWKMHDKLFANQRELAPEKFETWAKEAGLDVARFRKALETGPGRARIAEDMQLASQVGAQGTPTIFVNCRKVVGALPFDAFKPIVDDEMRRAEQLLQQGAKLDAGFYDKVCEENVSAVAQAAVP
jgi:protein-disulfide isomerase